MSSSYTKNLGLRKPTHRDPETLESWDAVLNNNFDILDLIIGLRQYTSQNYIVNSDSLAQALNKIDMKLKDLVDSSLTSEQLAALLALLGYGVRLARKDVLFPEFPGATFCVTPGSPNLGIFTTDSEIVTVTGLGYRFNYYEWYSLETALLQSYDILVQWRVPDTFVNFGTTISQSKVLILDIRTQSADVAESCVAVELWKDGTDPTDPAKISTSGPKRSQDGNWRSLRFTNEVIFFDGSDNILKALVPGDLLNVRITMSSKDNNYARVGPITISYVG
jgi:hypothetical protein